MQPFIADGLKRHIRFRPANDQAVIALPVLENPQKYRSPIFKTNALFIQSDLLTPIALTPFLLVVCSSSRPMPWLHR
jgi:hypothetical protein